MELFQKAMGASSVAGYTGMAFLYLEGYPHPSGNGRLVKNATLAFEHFRFAAKRHDLSAMFYLGLMYFNGLGIKQPNYREAFEWFMRAARNGHAQSLYYSG